MSNNLNKNEGARLHPHSKNGYWIVGDKFFFNKIEAHIESQRSNKQIEFYFGDTELATVDWTQEPEVDIYELYRQRALQLRESYDHIVLLYSGGSDSTAVLKTFLENNIKLDEVITTGVLNNKVGEKDTTNAELYYQGMSLVSGAELRNTKFRFYNLWDNFKELDKNLPEDWFIERGDTRLCIDNPLKEYMWHRERSMTQQVHKGKKVCYIMGFEKPRVFIKDGWFQFGFLDLLLKANQYTSNYNAKTFNGIYTEFFFTAIDFPDIMRKQVHMIADYYVKHFPATVQDKLVHTAKFDKDDYYNTINDIIYGRYWKQEGSFTVGKAKGDLFGPKWMFMKDFKDTNYYKTWSHGVKTVRSTLNPDAFTDLGDLGGHWGKMYKFRKHDDTLC